MTEIEQLNPEKPPIRVPRRRPKTSMSVVQDVSSNVLKIFDAHFIFQKTRAILFYGFTPAVIWIGMTTEPTPASFWELINILE